MPVWKPNKITAGIRIDFLFPKNFIQVIEIITFQSRIFLSQIYQHLRQNSFLESFLITLLTYFIFQSNGGGFGNFSRSVLIFANFPFIGVSQEIISKLIA